MNKKSIFFLLLFITNFVTGQNSKLEVLESVEFREQVRTSEVVAMHSSITNERGIIRFSESGYLTFDVFDENLQPSFTKVIEIHRKEEPIASLYFDNQIKVFTLSSPKKREREVYCYVFDIEAKTDSKHLIFEKVLEKNQSLFSGKNKRQTSFASSPNGRYFSMLTDNIKKTSNSFDVHVFDSETLDLLFKKSYTKEVDRYFNSNDLKIDDKGSVYVIGKQYFQGRSDKKLNKANYEFVLNKVTENDVQSTSIKLEEEFVSSLSFGEINDEVLLVGFYSEKNSSRVKGGCSFKLNADNLNFLSKKVNILPANIYESLYGYRVAKRKKDKELSNFYIDYVIEDSQSNIYLVAEEFYITTTYMNNGMNGMGMQMTTYHYDDILVLKFNVEGDLLWGGSIFKRANSPSYSTFLKDDNLHIILNSGKKVKEKEDGRSKVSKRLFESTSLYDLVFTEDGELSYDKIQDNRGRDKDYYLPAYGTYTSDGSFIMINKARPSSAYRRLMLLR